MNVYKLVNSSTTIRKYIIIVNGDLINYTVTGYLDRTLPFYEVDKDDVGIAKIVPGEKGGFVALFDDAQYYASEDLQVITTMLNELNQERNNHGF